MTCGEKKMKEMPQEWVLKAYNALSSLIGRVPYGLECNLGLKSVYEMSAKKRSGNRECEPPPTDTLVRDFRKAMRICELTREQIAAVYKILGEISDSNDRMMADLRNNYPTPYDSEDFVKAWRYAHKDSKRLARFFEGNPTSVEDCKKAYEKFCGLFYGCFHDVPCHIKTFIQADDQRYGEIEFYVEGIVGDFHLYLPQNHMLEYGNSPCGSMKMSVSYSAPDCSGYTTGNYRTVAESYDLGELADLFKSAIEEKKGQDCDLRMMDYYIALAENQRKEVEDYCAKNGKTYEKFIEEMKDSIMKATKGEIG